MRQLEAMPEDISREESTEVKEGENRFCGRILRGEEEKDFKTLSDNSQRRVVFFLPESELKKIKDIKSDYQKLIEIGWSPEEIEEYIRGNKKFKIVEFPANPEFAKPATWDNVIEIICRAYPDLAGKIKSQAEALKSTPYSEIFNENEDLERMKGDNQELMTPEKYAASSGSLTETRAFLRDTININEQFTGEGYTKTADGKKGVLELVGLNCDISEIPNVVITDLNVRLPEEDSQEPVAEELAIK